MKCVTWSGTKPVLVCIYCLFLVSSFYDLNANDPAPAYPDPKLQYSPGEYAKDLSGGGAKERQVTESRGSAAQSFAQSEVYVGGSKASWVSYDTSSDNSVAASLDYKYGNVVSDYSMEKSIRKGDYSKDRVMTEGVGGEEIQKRDLSKGAAKYVYEHQEAAARLAELTKGIYHEDPKVHEALHGDVGGKTFEEAFKGYKLGDVQEHVREMIDKICDPSKSNMELLVNAVGSIEGVDGDGNKHSDKYLKETKVKVSSDKHDYSFLFGGRKEVSPQDIVDCYKRLKNEIIDDSNENIDTEHKDNLIKGLQELLSESFKSYNHSCNGSLGSKDDNMFLNIRDMNELIKQEDGEMKEVIKYSNLPEKEPEPSYHDVIRAFVKENDNMFPTNLNEYMDADKNKKDDVSRKTYRENTKKLIEQAAKHPSLEMAAFLLSSASENTNSSGAKHSEAIYGYTFETSDKYSMTIAEAMEMVQNMPDSESKDRIIADIIEKGIGGYYEKYNAMGTFEKSEKGFHFSFDVNKLEQGYQHEHEEVWRKINEAVKKNTKSKENSAND